MPSRAQLLHTMNDESSPGINVYALGSSVRQSSALLFSTKRDVISCENSARTLYMDLSINCKFTFAHGKKREWRLFEGRKVFSSVLLATIQKLVKTEQNKINFWECPRLLTGKSFDQ